MTWIEAIAVVFGVLAVWFTVRQNIWCWPLGLVQVALYIHIFYQVRLYSDLILHVIYVGLGVYGWWCWRNGADGRPRLPVSLLPMTQRLAWPTTIILITVGLGYFMDRNTDASLPYGDAFTTVASLCAQWLMTRKRLESWLGWIAVDVVAIGIYLQKELFLTAGLYALFLGLAVAGFASWRRELRVINRPKEACAPA